MRNLILFIIKNKDHFVFAVTVTLSVSLLFNRNNDEMSVIRGFSSDIISFLSSPMVKVKSLAIVSEENHYLRERNLQLNLQLESILYAADENENLRELLDFKRKTKLKIIPDERGEIMHMLKSSDGHFSKFGEIYFATAYPGVIKGWHLHKTQEQNYCVLKGMIKLVIYDPRKDSPTYNKVQEIFLGEKNYSLVKIPPGLINGWKCIGNEKAILGINTVSGL